MNFRKKIIKLLEKATGRQQAEIERLLTVPPDPKLGDYAFPCFILGKPKEEAEKLKGKLKLPSFIAKVEVVGPYLNFYLDNKEFAETVLTAIKKEQENFGRSRDNKNVIIEYCGPNTNKPLHLGHVRNMALGNAMVRILQFRGNKVHPVNIVNDRGIHICQSMLAYQKWGKEKNPDKKGDHFVGDYYVMFAKKTKENDDLKKEAQELLLKWERKDPDVRKLWRKMNKWVLDGFEETYQRFGVSFEKEYFESEYYEEGKEVVKEGLQKGVFEKDHTEAVLAPLEQFGLPNKILLRGDETSLYITQDLYLADLRYKDFHFDHMTYVVASEQQLHFKQLFKILDLLRRPYAKHLYHLSYGLVHLPSGRMKSREGTVVDADDIMDETAQLAAKEVKKRYENLLDKEITRRAEFISLAALKFFMLKTDAIKDIIFNPEDSLNFEGETGPYVQYTHARACSVLAKAGKQQSTINFSILREEKELAVIRLLALFPEKVEETAAYYKPHVLCRYLLDLAQAFNEFYHACKVISEDKENMAARLLLVYSVKQVLANGLQLLGITAPEEM